MRMTRILRFAGLRYFVVEERFAVGRVVSIRRDYQDGGPIMKKLGMLGIIGGAAILTAMPLSLQWSQKNTMLSLDSAEARIGRPLTATSIAGVNRRVHRRAYRHAAYASAVAGVGAYGSGSYYGFSSLADCGSIPYGTSYVAPCGIYSSSSYAAAYERLQAAATAAPSSYSYAAPYSYYGLSSYYRRP
jgi:hypothetical protein